MSWPKRFEEKQPSLGGDGNARERRLEPQYRQLAVAWEGR